MGLIDFRPLLSVTINGTPLAAAIFSQVASVRVTDVAGFASDTAEITFANGSLLSRMVMPEPGAEIEIAMGFLGKFKSMGLFIADEVEESSPPRVISVTARAKAQGATQQSGFAPIQQQKTRTWADGITLKDIVSSIASDNGLDVGITDAVASIVPGHIDQIDESDMAVLTRIAMRHDLVAKPAGGVLFVGGRAGGKKASGEAVPTTTLTEPNISSWTMRRSLGDATGSVIATYRDLSSKSDIEVRVGENEPIRRLRGRYKSKDEAKTAAQTEAKRAGRAKETLEIELPGNPNIAAEGTIVPVGFSSACSGNWLVTSVSHELSDAGFITSLRAERPE